jgi:predicted nucleic acid-binding protein
VDASVVVDLVTRFRPRPVEALLWAPNTVLTAPELIEIEVLNALRRLDQTNILPSARRAEFPTLLQALRIRKYRHASLIEDIWALRHNLTAYDAAYVVLAKVLNATLITRDERLANAPGLPIETAIP